MTWGKARRIRLQEQRKQGRLARRNMRRLIKAAARQRKLLERRPLVVELVVPESQELRRLENPERPGPLTVQDQEEPVNP